MGASLHFIGSWKARLGAARRAAAGAAAADDRFVSPSA